MKHILFLLSFIFCFSLAIPVQAADGVRPVISLTSPSTATAGVATLFSATVSDEGSGIASCNLYVNNDDVGAMSVQGGTASKSYTFTQAGVHTMFVFCRDNSGEFQSGENASVVVSVNAGDPFAPSVSSVTPTTVAVGVATALSASVSDVGTGITQCELIIDGFSQGTMAIFNGVASRSHTFTATGSASVYAQCTDGAGNSTAGTVASVLILNSVPSGNSGTTGSGDQSPTNDNSPFTPPANPNPRLIKIACPAGVIGDHPCRAVYYHGLDNKRHAFPNAKVYGSWYEDFSGVVEVSAEVMANVSLGAPVTYRPGVHLVKFTTDPKVYAVAKGGLLRWISTEALAIAYYGLQWNKNIDDISDAFFTHYKFGADITKQSDYSPTGEIAGTTTIDANF